MNPYTFVPLPGPPRRERPNGHLRFVGNSGTLTCLLTARTPLFVYDRRSARPAEPPAGPGHELADFPTDAEGRPLLPAAALRGALRSVAEAASLSCLTLFDGHYERWTVDYRSRLPAAYRRCESAELLCPACRLFGTVGGLHAGYAGAVAVSDAVAEAGAAALAERMTVAAVQSPKPHHQAFYLAPDGSIAGRKFYYHRPNGPVTTIERSRFSRTIQPLAAGSALPFTLRYRDLADDDLRLLLFALVLEPGLGHKLGMGKPLGLGSATIELQAARNTAPRDAAVGRPGEELTGEGLREWVDALLYPLRDGAGVDLGPLRQVLALDPGRPVAYPSAEWFRSHPQAPLSEVPDVLPAPPAPRRVVERAPTPVRAGRVMPPPLRPTPAPGASGPGPRPPTAAPPRDAGQPARGEGPGTPPGPRPPRPAPPPKVFEPPAPEEEPEVPARPATLEDLVRRFSREREAPPRRPGETRESQRAREEQRRLMDRLRRGDLDRDR